MSVFPHWLRHSVFNADAKRKAFVLRLVAGLLDIRPTLNKNKRLLFKGIEGTQIPPIGHIHIPKTGGSFLSKKSDSIPFVSFNHVLLRNSRSDKWCPVGLTPISYKKTDGFYLFSAVRNPLVWLISYYYHVRSFGDHRNSKHYDYELAQEGFDILIKAVVSRSSPWPSKKFLFPQLFGQNKEPVIDWVNRNESLVMDLSVMFDQFSVTLDIDSARVRSAPKDKLDHEYYSDELLTLVCHTYRREMELFGYHEFKCVEPLVNLKLFREAGVTYDYQADTLKIEGRSL